MPEPTLADVDALAAAAHAGQVDKTGAPYVTHVRAVAAGMAPFGTGLQMAGLLHDVLEDTDLTADDLLRAGVPSAVVATVRRLTRDEGTPYDVMVREVAADHAAVLVKIADNAHNSLASRSALLDADDRARLAGKYRAARQVLWPAAGADDVRAIVSIVNPALLDELA
ncbi:phosphohydrolase [Kitasatospora sp. NBC_01539]|uniref:phosphohydrolase n=1 Tax=Kitasatospora sp. NBC_01539 TaxID=2903577 RepID=UPI0038602142